MILLAAHNNISMKNVIQFVKSVKSLNITLLNQLYALWLLLTKPYYLLFL